MLRLYFYGRGSMYACSLCVRQANVIEAGVRGGSSLVLVETKLGLGRWCYFNEVVAGGLCRRSVRGRWGLGRGRTPLTPNAVPAEKDTPEYPLFLPRVKLSCEFRRKAKSAMPDPFRNSFHSSFQGSVR